MKPMLALTVWQPYAWLLVNAVKPVENRSWAPPPWLLGKWYLIHAAKKTADDEAWEAAAEEAEEAGIKLPSREDLEPTRGTIVGAGRVVGTVVETNLLELIQLSMWATGPVCWVHDKVVAFDPPVEARGKQKLWTVPERLRDTVRARFESAPQTPVPHTNALQQRLARAAQPRSPA